MATFELPNDQINDAQVVNLLVRFVVRHVLLLLLNLPHQLFRLVRLRRHDVRHAQVGQHDCAHGQNLRKTCPTQKKIILFQENNQLKMLTLS